MEVIVDNLINQALETAISYKEYRAELDALVADAKSGTLEQTDEYLEYRLLNQQRMKRLDKSFQLSQSVQVKLKEVERPVIWLVLIESWCGDGAQSLPVLNKMAEASPNISLKIALRDQHLPLMDEFLTDGGRSIPKLIMLDESTEEVMETWGPRPSVATAMVREQKSKFGEITPEFRTELQRWYSKDKGLNVVSDILKLLALE